jgi:hypothetical protein
MQSLISVIAAGVITPLIWRIVRAKASLPNDARSKFRDVKLEWAQDGPVNVSMAQSSNALWQANGSCPRYLYPPLKEPRHIRLLKVTCEGPERRFRSELIHISLDHLHLQYVAISYTWGDDAIKSTIPCGRNQQIGLSASVSTILDTLINAGETLVLWIDALCIDQNNNPTEKGSQVRLMKDIYQSARQVAIILGEKTFDSDVAMDFVGPLRHALQTLEDRKALISLESVVDETGVDFPGPRWTAFRRLLEQPWFTRIWVIQEFAVGKNPIFIWGSRAVEADDLMYITTLIMRHGLSMLVGVDHEDPERSQVAPIGLVDMPSLRVVRGVMQQTEQTENKGMVLQQVLTTYFNFNATNPRDKVFALLGLACDAQDKVLDPDYNSATNQIYAKTARYLLLRDRSIRILHYAGIGFPRVLQDLPSWVPDWSVENRIGRLGHFGGFQEIAGYRASGNSIPQIQTGPTPESLIMTGYLVDTVEQIGPVRTAAALGNRPKNEKSYKVNAATWMDESRAMLDSLNPQRAMWVQTPYPTGETLQSAYWRTLIGNFIGAPATSKDEAHYLSWLVFIPKLLRSNPTIDWPKMRGAESFDLACSTATAEKRFITTRKGLMGLSSPGTRQGDRIAIFLGGATPFIVRENPDVRGRGRTYTLVSEAYVHGLMNGEGMDVCRIEELELR